ncbi:hypothetical protein [Embleya sp. NBC_00896]|uniref:hypothetical protein n=1 Tax=Embleya sp. NBC_00896 TaxID=2975961 RepID=UPI002F90C19B|nr:hypothetical protein OG928_48235 [Embleya sp. NBC_00896]
MTDLSSVRDELVAAGWKPDYPDSSDIRKGRAWWTPRDDGTCYVHGQGYDGQPNPHQEFDSALDTAAVVAASIAFAGLVREAELAHWARFSAATGSATGPTHAAAPR